MHHWRLLAGVLDEQLLSDQSLVIAAQQESKLSGKTRAYQARPWRLAKSWHA